MRVLAAAAADLLVLAAGARENAGEAIRGTADGGFTADAGGGRFEERALGELLDGR